MVKNVKKAPYHSQCVYLVLTFSMRVNKPMESRHRKCSNILSYAAKSYSSIWKKYLYVLFEMGRVNSLYPVGI